LDVKLISVRRNIFKFNGSAYVDSQLITSAELLTTVIT